jgi:hypothetical protein
VLLVAVAPENPFVEFVVLVAVMPANPLLMDVEFNKLVDVLNALSVLDVDDNVKALLSDVEFNVPVAREVDVVVVVVVCVVNAVIAMDGIIGPMLVIDPKLNGH